MKVFQNKNGGIYDHNIFVDTENCNDKLCWSNYDKNAFVNVTILLGAPISCDGSIFGILKNGMFIDTNDGVLAFKHIRNKYFLSFEKCRANRIHFYFEAKFRQFDNFARN